MSMLMEMKNEAVLPLLSHGTALRLHQSEDLHLDIHGVEKPDTEITYQT